MPKRNGTGIALLADPTRRRIVQLCALRPRRPSALAVLVDRSRPAISRQLRILREARILREIPAPHDRRGALFCVNPDELGRIVAWLAGTEIGLDPSFQSLPRKRSPVGQLAKELPADSEVRAALEAAGVLPRQEEPHDRTIGEIWDGRW